MFTTMVRIQAAFEQAGIQFIDDDETRGLRPSDGKEKEEEKAMTVASLYEGCPSRLRERCLGSSSGSGRRTISKRRTVASSGLIPAAGSRRPIDRSPIRTD